MANKLAKLLYNCWKDGTESDKHLLENIKRELNSGKSGAEHLLDWAREYFEDNESGNYPQYDTAWDICNWYYDYLNKDMTKKKLNELLDYYL